MSGFLMVLKNFVIWFAGWLVKSGVGAQIGRIVSTGLMNLARKAVAEVADIVENKGLLNDVYKRRKAAKKIRKYAREEGIEVADHLVNLAIELAVGELKGRKEEGKEEE